MSKSDLLLQSEIERVFATFKLRIYHALQGEIIPSLRAVDLNWTPGQEYAEIVFFHDGLVDEELSFRYSAIEMEASCCGLPKWNGEEVLTSDTTVCLPMPASLPPVSEVVFFIAEQSKLEKYLD